jgi:hypothetical protein
MSRYRREYQVWTRRVARATSEVHAESRLERIVSFSVEARSKGVYVPASIGGDHRKSKHVVELWWWCPASGGRGPQQPLGKGPFQNSGGSIGREGHIALALRPERTLVRYG